MRVFAAGAAPEPLHQGGLSGATANTERSLQSQELKVNFLCVMVCNILMLERSWQQILHPISVSYSEVAIAGDW